MYHPQTIGNHKVLNRSDSNKNCRKMKKRCQIELAILLAIGLVVVIGGTIYTGSYIAEISRSTESDFHYRFLGDPNSQFVFDTEKCNVKLDSFIVFQSLGQAHSLGFNNAPSCT